MVVNQQEVIAQNTGISLDPLETRKERNNIPDQGQYL